MDNRLINRILYIPRGKIKPGTVHVYYSQFLFCQEQRREAQNTYEKVRDLKEPRKDVIINEVPYIRLPLLIASLRSRKCIKGRNVLLLALLFLPVQTNFIVSEQNVAGP